MTAIVSLSLAQLVTCCAIIAFAIVLSYCLGHFMGWDDALAKVRQQARENGSDWLQSMIGKGH